MVLKKIKKVIATNSLITSIISSTFVKGMTMIVTFASVPIYMNYFEDQRVLGIWFAILSVMNWILTFDLGIGNGLRNKLVISLVNNKPDISKKYISSSYYALSTISITLIIAFSLIIFQINWNNLLNIQSNVISLSSLRIMMLILCIGLLSQFILKLITSILLSLQKNTLANFTSLISQSSILIFISLYSESNPNISIVVLSIINILAINVPLIFTSYYVFKYIIPFAKPNIKYCDKDFTLEILKLGLSFFWIQLSLLIINLSNEILILIFFQPENVVEYQVYNRYFMIFLTVFTIVTVPVWSAITKANVQKNIIWIKNVYLKMQLLSIVLIIPILFSVYFFQEIVNLWLMVDAIEVKLFYSLIFGIYYIELIFIYATSSIANGIGDLKIQMFCNTTAAIIKIPITVVSAYFIEEWIIVVIINILILLPLIIIQPYFINKKLETI